MNQWVYYYFLYRRYGHTPAFSAAIAIEWELWWRKPSGSRGISPYLRHYSGPSN